MTDRKPTDAAAELDSGPLDGEKNIRVGRIDSLRAIRIEASRVYKATRQGKLETQDARRMVACLVDIAGLLERGDLERRLELIEERLKHADH